MNHQKYCYHDTQNLKWKIYTLIVSTLLLGTKEIISVKAWTTGSLLPEIAPAKIDEVSKMVSNILDGDVSQEQRKIQVQDLTGNFDSNYEENQFVYGELSIPTLATLFDAVGIHENERFLDIGSGDGALVFATALLYDGHVSVSRGVEIVPVLKDRSEMHRSQFKSIEDHRIEFHCADIYNCDETLEHFLADTTIAVCFATTWSRNYEGRKLPELSKSLGKYLKPGARVVMIDGKIDESDNFLWCGDLRIQCPDTAPYSIASLYEKV